MVGAGISPSGLTGGESTLALEEPGSTASCCSLPGVGGGRVQAAHSCGGFPGFEDRDI